MQNAPHIPVLLNEVLEILKPAKGQTIIDCTFGYGGYTEAILKTGANVIAFDRDPSVLPRVKELQKKYGNLEFHNLPFSQIGIIKEKVDSIVMDIGVSSMQIDTASRGFSFRFDALLDMRMGEGATKTAADILNTSKPERIAKILREYGEVSHAGSITKKLISNRPIETTAQLTKLLPHKDIPKVFQALRIAVNDELNELATALAATKSLLAAGGRLVIVSFHSLEDRIAKNFFTPKQPSASRYAPTPAQVKKDFQTLAKNAIIPSTEEVALNPRAASAKLRAGIRI
ncbi:MAG: 16S rRNA (cytosine(1402)-N(4))-methyltransferase RsmH [Alphaproteobacteria bacterium]|nr:16S rRNA (cytosine(1402)-N(4))-methyltransferase RsmH [Alphaproteobacteria bacterium]